jgi:hypothetical protein
MLSMLMLDQRDSSRRAIQRASCARRGPSCSDAATAPDRRCLRQSLMNCCAAC